MNNHGHHFRYSEEERHKRQNPEAILRAIGLKAGICFIDVGCNDGFFTLPAARMVGEGGKVIATDIDEEALERLKSKLRAEGITNTEVIAGPAEEVIAGDSCADTIFFGTVLHDFQDPLAVLKNAKHMLKDDGIIYDYDWRKQDSPSGPPFAIRFSQEHVAELAAQAGLTVAESKILDDNFYAMILKH